MSEEWNFITAPADSFAGVLFPTPGGLTFYETADLVDEISHISPIRGICLFEVRPELDFNDMTASTAAHLLINFIGTLAKHRHTNGPSS